MHAFKSAILAIFQNGTFEPCMKFEKIFGQKPYENGNKKKYP